ncbi:unnamed protein product [Closterium sp. Naga37s-1]|nr:unnamed protein product [Closterium sp. Naga37s-1]
MWRAARAAQPADVTDSWRGPERDVEPGVGDSRRVQSGAAATAGRSLPAVPMGAADPGGGGSRRQGAAALRGYRADKRDGSVMGHNGQSHGSVGDGHSPCCSLLRLHTPPHTSGAPPCFCPMPGLRSSLVGVALAAAEEPYVRWSCADVTVVTAGSNACHGCSGGIAPCALSPLSDSWQCACPAQLHLSGSYCERKDECMVDSDCGVNAKCIDILSSNSPTRQCFCAEGWMGPQCAQRSPLSLDAAVDTSSWWKEYPFNLTIPITTTATTINTITNATAGGLMTPSISAASAGIGGAAAAAGDGAVAGGGVRYMTIWWKILKDDAPDASLPGESNLASFGPQIEVAIAAPTTSYVAIGWRPANLPWVPPPNINPSRATPFPPSPPSPPPPSPSPPPPHRVPVREASAGVMPAMFQQDMTIVTARGGYYRIQDAWTFSTHGMPIADTAMGGTDDITAATAHEDAASGTTYVKFRRPLLPSDDSFDHAITDNDFTLVWALGQPSPALPSTGPLLSSASASASATQTLSTLPSSPFPSSSASASLPPLVQQQIAAFYRADELKYHGGSSSSRGSFPRINLFLGSDPLNSCLCTPSPLPGFSCSLALQGDRVTLHWALLPTSISLALQVTDCKGWLSVGFTPSPSSSSPSKLSALGSYVVLADVSQASAGVSRVTPYSRAAAATSTAAAAAGTAGGGTRTTGGAAAGGASSGGAGAAGNPVVRSYILVNHTAQGLQSSNRLEFTNASVTLVNGSALLSFSRPYTQRNGAPNISLGADELSHLVWAFAPNAFSSSGGSASLPNHYLQHRGSLWLNWASGEAQVQASPFPWLIAHASIMAFVFCFLLPLSAIAARLLAVRPDSNRPVFHPLHVLSALLTPLLLVPALAFAIHAASFFRTNAALLLSIAPSAPHRLAALLTPHGLLGGALVLFLVIEVICALLCRPSPGSPGHAWWMLLHRVLGVGLLLGGAANVALGALQLAMLLGQPLWLCVGVPLLPWALLSLLYLLLQLARPTPAAPPKLQAEDFDVLAAAMRTKVTGFKGAGAAGVNGGAGQGEGVSGGVVGGLEEWPPAGVKWPTARRSAPGTPSGPQRQQQSPTRSFGSVSELGSTTDSSPPQREPLYGRPFISHSSGESSSSGGEQRRLTAPEIHTRLPRVSGAEVAGRSGRHGGREHCLCLSLCHPRHPCIPASPAVAANSASLAVLACLASSADSSLDVAQSHASISPSMASATPSDGLAQSPPPPAAEFTADPATSVAEAGATWQAEASSQTRSQSPSAELARQSQGPVETPAQDSGAAGKGEGGEIPAGDSSGVDEIPADGGVPSAAAPTPAAPAAPAASAAPAAPAAPAPPAAPAVGEEQSTGGSVGTPAAALTTAGSSRGLNAAAPAFVPQFACAGVGAGADVAWLPAHLPLLPLPFNTPGTAQQGVAGAPFAGYGGGISAHALAQGVGGGWGDAGWEAGGGWGAQDALGAMWGSGADGGRREGRADGMAGGGGAGGTARVEFYFSDDNMPYDHHLLSMANHDPQGFVSLWYLAQFREVRSMLHPSMSTAPGSIVTLLADAIREASSSTTLVLSDDGMRVRRQQPFPFTDVDELQARTVVAHNLPPNLSLSAIEDIFKQAGRVRMVRLCTPQASGHTASAVAHVRVAAATAPSTAAAAAAAPSNADAPSAAAAPAAADAPSAAAAAAPSAAADLVTGASNSHGEASSCAKFHALIEFETVKEAHNAVETLNSSDWRHGMHVKLFKKLTKACSGDPLCDSCAAAPAASPTAHGKKSRAGKGRGRGGEGGGNKHGAAGGAGGAAAGRGGAGGVGSKGSAPGAAAAAAGGSGGGGGSSGGGGEAVGSKPLPGPRGPDGSRGFSLGRGKRMPGS